MKCLVLLAGCGLGDGSCIEEVILTYVVLDKYGCDYTPVAEDVSIQSVNHLTEQIAEKIGLKGPRTRQLLNELVNKELLLRIGC